VYCLCLAGSASSSTTLPSIKSCRECPSRACWPHLGALAGERWQLNWSCLRAVTLLLHPPACRPAYLNFVLYCQYKVLGKTGVHATHTCCHQAHGAGHCTPDKPLTSWSLGRSLHACCQPQSPAQHSVL
jgi:hypothetical protein